MYCYIWVRGDIEVAQQIVQVGHVSSLAAWRYGEDVVKANFVVFKVADYDELVEVESRLEFEEIEYQSFYELDNCIGLTSLCTKPLEKDKVPSWIRKLDLWK